MVCRGFGRAGDGGAQRRFGFRQASEALQHRREIAAGLREVLTQPDRAGERFGRRLALPKLMSGDTEKFFRLPGGPIGFALGAEYRRETNFYENDPFVNHGLTFYNAIPTFTSPAFEVKEAYGELRLPILKDLPFFHDLTVNAAGRVADYRGGTGITGALLE